MKYSLLINQAGVVREGLLGKVHLPELCLLNYLDGWSICARAERIERAGAEFFWIDYHHAVDELPLLFNPQATVETRKNSLCGLVAKLRHAGLIETTKDGRRLFFRLTDKAIAVADSREQEPKKKSEPMEAAPHDDNVAPAHDDTLMSSHDDSQGPINNKTFTMEPEIKEAKVPPTPFQGDEDAFTSIWNSRPALPKIQNWTARRRKRLAARLQEPFFRGHWREAVERIARSSFCTGHGQHSRKVTLDWFLRSGTLTDILEGRYDNTPVSGSKYQAQIVRADEFKPRVGKR